MTSESLNAPVAPELAAAMPSGRDARCGALLARIRPWFTGAPALVFLALFFLLPVGGILLDSLRGSDGTWGLEQYRRLAAEPSYAKVIAITFGISLAVALVAIVLAYPLAVLFSRFDAARRSRWMVWLMIPFWTSYLVKTFAWILVLSRTGVLGSLVKAVGSGIDVAVIPSFAGVLIGMVHALLPLAVVSMLPIMQGIPAQLGLAAQTLGAGRRGAFLGVFVPLSLPGVAAAGLLVFITSLGFFIVPALLGSPKQTMVAQLIISVVMDLFNLPFAGALSAVLLLATVVVFLIYDRLAGLSTLGGTPADRRRGGAASRLFLRGCIALGRWLDRHGPRGVATAAGRDRGLRVFAVAVLALLVLPALIVVPISFTNSSFLEFPPRGFSLRWYEGFLGSPVWQVALVRSLGVAFATAVASVAMGLGASLTLARTGGRVGNALFAFLVAPLILPRIVVAVGLYYLFAPLGLVGTDIGLVLGHTVIALPYVVVTMSAALKRYDWRLDDAARILGASAPARLRTVMIPLLLPSLAAAFLLSFLTSFDELSIALFTSGGLTNTLPKQMWDDMTLQVNPTLAAVSTTLLVVVGLSVLLLSRLRRDRHDHA